MAPVHEHLISGFPVRSSGESLQVKGFPYIGHAESALQAAMHRFDSGCAHQNPL